MNIRVKVNKIILSFDFISSVIGTIIFSFLIKEPISADIIKEISSLVVSTLAIIFSVFFAAIAVIMTSGDNEFVIFMQQEKTYTEFVWSYKYSFIVIFLALLLSLIVFITALFEVKKITPGFYPLTIVSPYVFFTLYALFCTVESAMDAIVYSEYRSKYLIAVNKKDFEDKK